MDRRPLVVLSFGFLLVLAGCSGLPGGGSTDTPGGDSDGGAATGTAGAVYPEGYGEGGIADPQAATRAHVDAITSYDSFTITYNATVRLPNRTTEVAFAEEVDARERRAYLVSNISDGTSVSHYYANGTVYVRSESPRTNGTTYSSRERELNVEAVSGRRFVRPVVSNVTYGPAERVERGGETMLRYEATGLDAAGGLLGEGVSAENVTSFSATLLVDRDGLVRHVEYEATVVRHGEERSTTVTIDVTGLDATTVERPGWVDGAAS